MRLTSVLAVATVLVVSACGPNELDTRRVEDELTKDFDREATCPAHVESVAGHHFTCTVGGGDPYSVEVTITDGGGFSYTLGGGMPVPEFGPRHELSQVPQRRSLIKPPCFLRSGCGQTDSVLINHLGGGLPSPEFGPPVG